LIGLSLLHVPSIHVGDKNINNEYIMPRSLQFGINYLLINNLLITGSIEHNKEKNLTGSTGFEYTPFEDFKIRTGVRNSPLRPSLGVGYRIANIQADVGMVYHSVLGTSMGIGISYSF
jgi:hypothetical protein